MKEYKAPAYASLALAFASLGDAFLYPFLPVNAAAVGVPVFWIGVLLSVNRFVRIFSNTWMVHLFAKHGLRWVTITAAILALISTAGYSIATTVVVWIILRVVWGLSFSAMRISTLGYALQHEQKGFALGLTRGIQEAGPMIALFLVPVLLSNMNIHAVFLTLACLSIPALFFAWNLPKREDRTPGVRGSSFFKIPSTLNTITFSTAFLIDGIIVVVLGILFLQYKTDITPLMATTLAAIYLGYRRICLVALSPAGGWIADKFGLGSVFNISLGAILIGLVLLTFGWIEAGVVLLFLFYSIHSAITPGKVSHQQVHPLSSVAENATWRDIGAASGTLAGGFLLTSENLTNILILATSALLVLVIFYWKKSFAFNPAYLWK